MPEIVTNVERNEMPPCVQPLNSSRTQMIGVRSLSLTGSGLANRFFNSRPKCNASRDLEGSTRMVSRGFRGTKPDNHLFGISSKPSTKARSRPASPPSLLRQEGDDALFAIGRQPNKRSVQLVYFQSCRPPTFGRRTDPPGP